MLDQKIYATDGDIVWLNNKLKWEEVGEKFNCDIEHWREKMLGKLTKNQFMRFKALFFAANLYEIEKFLEQFNIEFKK